MFQDPVIREAAQALYDENLPYHNFDHISYVLTAAENLLAACKEERIDVDEEVIYYALLFHDAGYQDDHISKGFDTKEAYSAFLAGETLRAHNIVEDVINQVKQAILCTHFSQQCANNNDKVVKAADLSGLAGDYDFFKSNGVKLMREQEILSGETADWNQWKVVAAEKLELYLNEDFSLTSDNAGNAVFAKSARENIQRMLEDELN